MLELQWFTFTEKENELKKALKKKEISEDIIEKILEDLKYYTDKNCNLVENKFDPYELNILLDDEILDLIKNDHWGMQHLVFLIKYHLGEKYNSGWGKEHEITKLHNQVYYAAIDLLKTLSKVQKKYICYGNNKIESEINAKKIYDKVISFVDKSTTGEDNYIKRQNRNQPPYREEYKFYSIEQVEKERQGIEADILREYITYGQEIA